MTEEIPKPGVPASGADAASLDRIRHEACDWLVRCLGKGLTPQEVHALKRWYNSNPQHAETYAEIRRAWRTLGPIADAATAKRANGREVFTARVVRYDPNRRALLGGALAAAAASAAYVAIRPPLSLWPSYAELTADYHTKAGEQRNVSFGNAISLDLNSKTSLVVRSVTAGTREIELLSGEAAISMRAGSPTLTVSAGPVRTIVSGADFNIRCDSGQGAISCLRGSLRIEGMDSVVQLAARQGVAFEDRRLGPVSRIDPDLVTAWQRGLLIFDAVPVARIIEEIGRYRSGRIVLMNRELGLRRMTAQLRVTETDMIVLQIERVFGAKATRLPGGVIILT